MGIFETIKRKLTGRDPKTMFQNDAKAAFEDPSSGYADIEDAKGDLLRFRADEICGAMRSTQTHEGLVDVKNHEAYLMLEAGLEDMFTKEEIKKFKHDPSIISSFRAILKRQETPSIHDKRAVKKYIQKYFPDIFPQKGDSPDKIRNKDSFISPIEDEISVLHKTLQSLLERFSGDLKSQASSTGHFDLESLAASKKGVAADIGMILKLKEGLDRHFNSIQDEIDFQQSIESIKKNGIEFLDKSVKGLGDWLVTCMKSGFREKPQIGPAIMKTFEVFGKILFHGSKFIGSSIKLTYNSLKKLFRKKPSNPTNP